MAGTYQKGANFERQVMAFLAFRDFFVLRSAGSHSAVDLVAFKPGITWFIQCGMRGRLKPKDREELLRLSDTLNVVPIFAWKSKGKVKLGMIKSKKVAFHYEIKNGHFERVED